MTGQDIMNTLLGVIASLQEYPSKLMQYKEACETNHTTADNLYNALQEGIVSNIATLTVTIQGVNENSDIEYSDFGKEELIRNLEMCKEQAQYMLGGLNEVRDLVVKIYGCRHVRP